MKGSIFAVLTVCVAVTNGWIWECDSKTSACQRKSTGDSNSIAVYPNVDICRLMCDSTGNIWPKPLNYTVLKQELVWIDARYPIFATSAPSNESSAYLNNLTRYFLETIRLNDNNDRCDENMYYLVINLLVFSPSMTLNWDTLEDYKLKMSADDSGRSFSVAIEASTVFGARHGLETFLQLLQSYDVNEQTCFVTLKELVIEDKPYYKHRGLLLDSARNYLSIETIKKNIVGMAMSKMNVLHWHLSDSQSFPFVSTRLPNMSFYGAYSEKETYTPSQITELLQFAKLHGVQIIPEIDGPAHAGSGWQWGADAGLGHLVLCYNQLPYKSYCIQPPCGQMNPANPKLYDVLKELYADISQLWSESNVFHMGGDEVNVPCWNSSEEIINYIGSKNRSEEAFLHLWGEFQSKALDAYDVASDSQKSIILWTSTLTDPKTIEKYLSKNRYVIQTWVRKSDHLPADLEKLGYRLIISTKDSWYLDHGFWGTTTYYSWQTIYDNQISNGTTVLGGEVCMWGELVDNNNIESRIWPRAAAAAERLWSNPTTSAVRAASRFFSQNDRLASRGIRTSSVVPEFCSKSNYDCENYLTK